MSDIYVPPSTMRATPATQQNLANVLESWNADLAHYASHVEGAAETFVYLITAMQQYGRRHGLRPHEVMVDNPRTVDTPDGAECRITFRRK